LGVVLVRWRFLYDSAVLVNDNKYAVSQLRSVRTWISLPMKETSSEFERVLIKILETEIVSLSEADMECSVSLFLADNKCLQAFLGILNTDYPCHSCYCHRSDFPSFENTAFSPVRTIDTK
jgi:hypothetical protein